MQYFKTGENTALEMIIYFGLCILEFTETFLIKLENNLVQDKV